MNRKLTVQQIVQQMVSAGVHFGHRRRLRNPKMIPYIYTEKDDLQIIDLLQTYWYLKIASTYLFTACRNGKRILFVGTKKHVAKCIEQTANDCNSWYINKRWLGGLLTNWETMQKSIFKMQNNFRQNHFSDTRPASPQGGAGGRPSERQAQSRAKGKPRPSSRKVTHFRTPSVAGLNEGPTRLASKHSRAVETFAQKSKKENARLGLPTERQKKRFMKYLGGVQTMSQLPDIVIIVGQQKEINAVRECQKLKIPSLTILDTNCDPSLTDFFIPANDDSVTSVKYILSKLSNAIKEGQKDFNNFRKKKERG